jgi:putative oxidoreductase
MGGAFVVAGVRNIRSRAFVAGLMAARGVPLATVVLWIGIVVQLVAGLALMAGFQTVWAASLLAVFLIAATPMFHNFWDHQGPERVARINGTIGNVALFGGFLAIIAQAA